MTDAYVIAIIKTRLAIFIMAIGDTITKNAIKQRTHGNDFTPPLHR